MARLAPSIYLFYMRLVHLTGRIDIESAEGVIRTSREHGTVALALLHQDLFCCPYLFRGLGVTTVARAGDAGDNRGDPRALWFRRAEGGNQLATQPQTCRLRRARRADHEAGEKNRRGHAGRLARASGRRATGHRPARQPNGRTRLRSEDPCVSGAVHADLGSPDGSSALRPYPFHGRGAGRGSRESGSLRTRVVSIRYRAKPARAAQPGVRRLRATADPGFARLERSRPVTRPGSVNSGSRVQERGNAAQPSSVGRTGTPCFSRNCLHSEILYSP